VRSPPGWLVGHLGFVYPLCGGVSPCFFPVFCLVSDLCYPDSSHSSVFTDFCVCLCVCLDSLGPAHTRSALPGDLTVILTVLTVLFSQISVYAFVYVWTLWVQRIRDQRFQETSAVAAQR
jgi:hypothetical protein